MDQNRSVTMRPIGRVVRGRSPAAEDDAWETAVAEIEIDAAWTGALDGLDGFSHVWVIWWLDRFDEPPERQRVHPERREELPLVGLLATRSPHRPNPIAITAVELLGRGGSCLRVRGLDAFEGTPVFDIKPYLRRGDLIPEATAPEWLRKLWQMHDQERET